MATVYLAFDPRFRRQVAIKVLPRQFTHDPRFLARFEREAQTIATLEHPAIVPVYDFGEHVDAPYLVMRYMPGGTLRERLHGKPVSLEEIAPILARLAPALDRAHELGIIHRDLKPSNILFDDDGRPYLADFGIARIAEASHTMTIVGTPAYMSPEQVEGDQTPDGRADIYALGVMLFELLTGRQPYEAETPTKQMMAHLVKPVPKILDENPQLPAGTQALIDKTMAKDREERYPNAMELVEAVEAVVASEKAAAEEAAEGIAGEDVETAEVGLAVDDVEAAEVEPETVEDEIPDGETAADGVDLAAAALAAAAMMPDQAAGKIAEEDAATAEADIPAEALERVEFEPDETVDKTPGEEVEVDEAPLDTPPGIPAKEEQAEDGDGAPPLVDVGRKGGGLPRWIWWALGLALLAIAVIAIWSILSGQEPQMVEVTRIVEQMVEVAVPGPEVEVEVPGPEVEVTRVFERMVERETVVDVVPFEEEWASSAHADTSAEAFVHWDEDDPAEVPTSCAKCHSTPGYLDYIGADGTEANVVENPAPIGTTVTCEACHNDATVNMTSVLMPSGVELMGLGDESRCMQCHQGRHSTVSVNAGIDEAGLTDSPDDISEALGFSNIHYYAAAATQYGTMAKGGYEYDGKVYDSKYDHVEGYDTCISCHDSHTLEIRLEECTECHTDVRNVEDFANVRMAGSLVDYDGDGDMEEGIYYEIEGLREMLYQAMRVYASEVTGTPIAYERHNYPYFFIDTDGDGAANEEEAVYPNQYNAWSPRLAKAAYNYQVSVKDPGRFAHGGKYIIQLLYDSTEDLNEAIAEPIDLSNARRIDHGHFAGSEEPFRHWDEDDPAVVPGSCSRCHSAAGLPLYIEEGVSISQEPANGFMCATCHSDLGEYTIYEVDGVEFPSGAYLSLDDPASNLCINCHQGRMSTSDVNDAIGDWPDDEVADYLRFRNIHYFAAGATLFGSEALGAYQYGGQEYAGRNEHVGGFDACVECHSVHMLEVEVEKCADCHEGVDTKEDLQTIRLSEADYDGDGDVSEGIAGEIATISEALLLAMQSYANGNPAADAIVYESFNYPYFFIDSNGNGLADEDEANSGNRYVTWTPALLRAAYNYQYSQKDPGAYAHNAAYVLQVLYDSLADIGGDVGGMTRPTR